MDFTYKLINNINNQSLAVNRSDGLSIPFDPANSDYAQYLIWLSEGNTPDPADPIPEPLELTPQEKLTNAGLSIEELKSLLGIK